MIDFAFVRRSGSGKTNVWNVTVTRIRILGTIAWFPKWGCYTFEPATNERLSAANLDKITAFMRSDAASAPAVGSVKRPSRVMSNPAEQVEPGVTRRESGPSLGEWVAGKKARRLKRRTLGAIPLVVQPPLSER
jgi:hypothetical protein